MIGALGATPFDDDVGPPTARMGAGVTWFEASMRIEWAGVYGVAKSLLSRGSDFAQTGVEPAVKD